MNNKKIQVIYKDVDELIPYINNPRLNDNAVDAVASSIKNFGFKNPILIDKNNEIINGHTRLKAAKKLGLKKAPVIVDDDLTEAQKKAFRLADNKVSEIAEWDFKALQCELEELESLEFDMIDFGFDDIEQKIDDDIDSEKSNTEMKIIQDETVIVIKCENESILENTFLKLQKEGYDCQLLTL